MRWFSLILLVLLLSTGATLAQDDDDETDPITLRVAGKCAANPHMMPFWVLMAQTEGEIDNVRLDFQPVTGPPQMMALAINGEFDVSFAFIFQGANMYAAGGADSLRVETISLWRAFALLTRPGVAGWDDLVGERILLPQAGSGGDVLTRLSMTNAGYDPEEDFQIEYMPPAQMSQLLVAGEAAAATVSEPQLTILASQAAQGDVELERASIDLMDGVFESDLWDADLLPLGVVLIDEAVLQDEALAEAYALFNQAYHEAAAFSLENPEEAAEMIVAQLDAVCDSRANPAPIAAALVNGFLVYDPVPAGDLLPDLADYVNLLYGENIDESFYITTETEPDDE